MSCPQLSNASSAWIIEFIGPPFHISHLCPRATLPVARQQDEAVDGLRGDPVAVLGTHPAGTGFTYAACPTGTSGDGQVCEHVAAPEPEPEPEQPGPEPAPHFSCNGATLEFESCDYAAWTDSPQLQHTQGIEPREPNSPQQPEFGRKQRSHSTKAAAP
eukprot:SAG22_NODE_3252_length_1829_cov_1.724277_2_plen_159_part_00